MPAPRPPLPPFEVGALVPSMRDFLQSVRTRRKGLSLIPHLPPDDAAREALRNAEAGAAAIALVEPGAAMAEAAQATRIPVLCLRLVASKDDYLAARAYGADAVVLDPDVDDATRADLAKGARSTRMLPLELARNEAQVRRAVDASARGIVLHAPDVASVRALAATVRGSATLVAWPARAAEEELRSLVALVDSAIVGVEVYGATGFERLVSELNP